jgi:hypothetical protein
MSSTWQSHPTLSNYASLGGAWCDRARERNTINEVNRPQDADVVPPQIQFDKSKRVQRATTLQRPPLFEDGFRASPGPKTLTKKHNSIKALRRLGATAGRIEREYFPVFDLAGLNPLKSREIAAEETIPVSAGKFSCSQPRHNDTG